YLGLETAGKLSWPELVGKDGYAAAAVVESQNQNVRAIVVKDGTPVPLDFRCDRVWVWVNDKNRVVRPPTVG
ncbi:protein inhibitor-like, partial [Dorcoceras hygrometricum]